MVEHQDQQKYFKKMIEEIKQKAVPSKKEKKIIDTFNELLMLTKAIGEVNFSADKIILELDKIQLTLTNKIGK